MLNEDKNAKSLFTAHASNLSVPSSQTQRKQNSSTASPPLSEAEKVRVKSLKDWPVARTDQESVLKIPIASVMISLIQKLVKHSSSLKLAGALEEGQDRRNPANNFIEMPYELGRGKKYCRDKKI